MESYWTVTVSHWERQNRRDVREGAEAGEPEKSEDRKGTRKQGSRERLGNRGPERLEERERAAGRGVAERFTGFRHWVQDRWRKAPMAAYI